MAKKKTNSTKVWVKKPVIGNTYYFKFAGGILQGVLDESSERLTELYNVKWFWIKDTSGKRDVRYPVSIYDISDKYNDLKFIN